MSSLRSNLSHDQTVSQPRLGDMVHTPSRGTQQNMAANIDSFNLIKIAMFMLGIGAVITPNALLLCASYYREEYNATIIYYIMPTYSISNIITSLILTKWGTNISFTSRIVISFVLSSITLFGLVRFANNKPWDALILIAIVFIIGMSSSILDRSLLGFTNVLETSYRHIHMSGEELSGVIASIIRVITRLCYGNDPVGSANTYFILIASYCLFCAALFATIRFTDYVALRLNIYVLYVARHKSHGSKSKRAILSPYSQKILQQKNHRSLSNLESINETGSESTKLSEEEYQKISVDDIYNKTSVSLQNESATSLDITDLYYSFNYKQKANTTLMDSRCNHPSYCSTKKIYSSLLFDDYSSRSLMFCKISKKVRLYCYIIFVANVLSWSIVPGMICGKITSDVSFIREMDWQSILLMSEYFISNYFGRLVLSSPSFWWCCCQYNEHNSHKRVVIRTLGCCPMCCGKNNVTIAHTFLIWLCVLRILLLYPIFIVIYLDVYDVNYVAHFLMILTGISQGYIYHMSFQLAPQLAPASKREATTSMLRLFHFGGIAIGSITAFTVNHIDNRY